MTTEKNKTIDWKRFKHLCFEAELIEIGDHRVINSEIGEDIVILEIEPSDPGLIVQLFFDEKCFPAAVDKAGIVMVTDMDGDNESFNEIKFFSTTAIEP